MAIIIAIPVIILFLSLLSRAGSAGTLKKQRRAFAALGNVVGKSKNDITASVGPPTSISAVAPNQQLLQWIITTSAGGYHVALLFENDTCLGITHESVS
jgi:hypothetical protein